MRANKRRKKDLKRKGREVLIILFLGILFLIILLFPQRLLVFVKIIGGILGRITGFATGDFGDLRLEIYSEITPSNKKYTYCGVYCDLKNKYPVNWDVHFYANFTRISNGEILDNVLGNCTLLFYTVGYGPVFNMTFNTSSNLWEYNASFNYKGNNKLNVSCSDGSGIANLEENFLITNTISFISRTADGFIDAIRDGVTEVWPCIEDEVCLYNFTANISEDDWNDVLTYGYNPSPTNTTLTNFTLDVITGILLINVTHTRYTGLRQIELNVRDSGDSMVPGSGVTQSALLKVNIQEVNDAPIFVNLANKSFNETQLFVYIINASDEEGDYPLVFNVSFLSCETAPWSTRNSINCTLFGFTNYSDRSMIINFTPSPDDVGNYTINFTVTDLNNTVMPYNSSRSMVVNFRVLNINDVPYFTYVCDNERNASEDVPFSCLINVSDPDDINLTVASNLTWFLNATNVSLVNGNGSVLVNFIAGDAQVGNWIVNISVFDYGKPRYMNSTLIWFFIENKNDSVFLSQIEDVVAYKNANYNILINASDNDLLIPDKTVFDERLSFSANVSWINFIIKNVSRNMTIALMNFTITESLVGNHTILVNVGDISGSNYTRIFTIFAYNNSVPVWNISSNFTLVEGNGFILDLSMNVSDPDNDPISFSHRNLTFFPSFTRVGSLISFTAQDGDVGFQRILLNASDGKSGISLVELTFNISNINDNPDIQDIGNQNATEDNRTRIFIDVKDEDLAIRQKDYFNESISYSILIINESSGNVSLFSLAFDSYGNDFVRLVADFTPRKKDVGNYTIVINVTDILGLDDAYTFNLSVFAINHAPEFGLIGNVFTGVGIAFLIDVNATDVEDGDENSGNITYNITFLPGTTGPAFFSINASNGVINFTADQSEAGRYRINLSVKDSAGLAGSEVFWIFVYDVPRISVMTGSPIRGAEDRDIIVNVRANHTVGDGLKFDWYINNELRYSNSTGNGTGGLTTLLYRLSFNDETTCGRDKNLTLNVSNQIFTNSTSWELIVNHTDQQPSFVNGPIPNVTAGNSYSLCLLSYFQDADYTDVCYNASLGFSFRRYNETFGEQSLGPIEVNIVHDANAFCADTIVFSSSSKSGEYFDLGASDGNLTVFSNIFHLELDPVIVVVPDPQPNPQPYPQPVPEPKPEPRILKIITPGRITILKPGFVQVPLMLKNDGNVDLFDIDLVYWLLKDGLGVEENITIDRNYFTLLKPGESRNVTMELLVNGSGKASYELFVNASVRSPRLIDWAKIDIELIETNTTEVEKILVFTEELIVENPECLELKELLEDAKELYSRGEVAEALRKTDAIVESCKQALGQKNRLFFVEKKDFSLVFYVVVLSIAFLFSGVLYHFLRRWVFMRRRESAESMQTNKA